MEQFFKFLIWSSIIIFGLIGVVGLKFSENKSMFEFMIWLVVSLVSVFFLVSLLSNKFVLSFIIAIIISFIGVRNA